MKICFWGNIAKSLIAQTEGGAELQIALLARALALKGIEVVIIDPYAAASLVTEEGITIVHIPNWNTGIKGIRMFLYRIPTLWKIFKEQKADYYYVRTESYLHLIPYLVARKNGAKFIHALAHDLDSVSIIQKFKIKYRRNFKLLEYIFQHLPNDLALNYLLKKSDFVFLQHVEQKPNFKSTKANFVLFPNIIDYNNIDLKKNKSKTYFIHVGTLTVLKGSENLAKLINILNSKIKVVVVGNPKDPTSEAIYKKLDDYANVSMKGRLDHVKTIELIANSIALLSTSNSEGFPNIFLEAWATGVPVISLSVDPGNVIKDHSLGVCCDGDLMQMKKYIEGDISCISNQDKLITYLSEFHDFTTAGDRFMKIINEY